MTTASKWSGVQVAIESARATAITVTAITKANPGVVSYTGTDPSDGNYLVFTNILGMNQVNNRIFRADNTVGGSNTTELEGENTSTYGTFTSGQAEVVTFGTTLSIVRGTSSSGGDFQFIDTTTIHDTVATQIPGLANAAVYNLELMWDPADSGFAALLAASRAQTPKCIKFTFSSGAIAVFLGYVGASGLPTGQAQGLVTSPAAITMFGLPTYYSS